MISNICFFKLNTNTPVIKKQATTNKLQRSPKADVVNFGAKDLNMVPKDIVDCLDNENFEFKTKDGNVFIGTIKEYLNDCIVGYRDIPRNFSITHCTHCKDTAQKIINDGLDWTKTTRMKCGPGTYFAMGCSAGSEFGSGGVPIKGIYIGDKKEYCVFKPCFYEAITGNTGLNARIKDLLDGDKNNLHLKYISRYCHDYLQYDLGLDFLYAGAGRGTGAFVVLNDKCMRLQNCY